MAEGTYEYECMRAELLGIEKPSQAEFESARAERLQEEEKEREAAEAKLLDDQEEALRNTGGKLDELNSILSSTQQKLNRFKQTACGSLSNIFSRGSIDRSEMPTDSKEPNAVSGSRKESKTDADDQTSEDLNSALDNSEMQQQEIEPVIPTERIRAAKLDIQKKMTSHLDKLDSLINKAENAEISMSDQTKQMRKMAK